MTVLLYRWAPERSFHQSVLDSSEEWQAPQVEVEAAARAGDRPRGSERGVARGVRGRWCTAREILVALVSGGRVSLAEPVLVALRLAYDGRRFDSFSWLPDQRVHRVEWASLRALDVAEHENRLREEIRRGSSLSKVLKLKKWEKVVG